MSDNLRAALDDIDRAMTFDVGECAECGAPPEDGHSDDCSRAPLNALPDARDRLRAALATSDELAPNVEGCTCDRDDDSWVGEDVPVSTWLCPLHLARLGHLSWSSLVCMVMDYEAALRSTPEAE